MPTPLEIHAQAEVDRLVPLEAATRIELSAARSELEARQSHQAVALKQVAEREGEVGAVRRDFGGGEVAANAGAGAEHLRDALIRLRAARSEGLDARLAMLAAQDRLAFAQAEHQAIRAGLNRARGSLAQTQQRATQLGDWAAALAPGSSLALVPERAAAVKASVAFIDAQAKIESATEGLPTRLRARALARLDAAIADDQAATTQLVQLEDTLDRLIAGTAGLRGQVQPYERKLDRAEAQLAQYVSHGQRWLNEAQTRLARIATRRSPSTAALAELAQLAGDEDRQVGLDAERAHDEALVALAELRRLRALRVAEIYADTSAVDPEDAINGDSRLASYDAAIATAEQAIHSDELRGADQRLRSWEADVPDVLWQGLLDFAIAEQLLDRLAAIVPVELLDDMRIAERDLADALTRARAIDHRIAEIRAAIERANTTVARRRETADERRAAMLRGLRGLRGLPGLRKLRGLRGLRNAGNSLAQPRSDSISASSSR